MTVNLTTGGVIKYLSWKSDSSEAKDASSNTKKFCLVSLYEEPAGNEKELRQYK